MLEELQRLQAHISVLKARLTVAEKENAALTEHQQHILLQHRTEIAKKDEIAQHQQQALEQLEQALTSEKQHAQQINQDAMALADRYGRLEKSCTDLKNRFQEILAERNELRAIKDKLSQDLKHSQQEIVAGQQERERLLQKNEHAKAKVEAIIQRLAILGTAQDAHAQEIQQLAHPTDLTEETEA